MFFLSIPHLSVLFPTVKNTLNNILIMVDASIAIIIAIWYLMAVSGTEPPSICPVIMPGSETIPIVAIVAMVGLIAALKLFWAKGKRASNLLAPNDKR